MESVPTYNLIDIVALILLLLGLLHGLRRGLSAELSAVISMAVSVGAGWYFYKPVGEQIYLATRLEEPASYALAFIVTLTGAFLLMMAIRLVLRSIMEFTFKGKIERIGGALCGLTRTALLTGALIFCVGLWPHVYLHRLFAEESLIGRCLSEHVPAAYESLSERYPSLPEVDRKNEPAEKLGPIEE